MRCLTLFLTAAALPLALAGNDASQDWPRFRGPRALGIMEGHKLPATWDCEKGTGVAWKTAIPGLANSSPIVADGAIYLTTAITPNPDPVFQTGRYGNVSSVEEDGDWTWAVLCVDLATGKIRWQREATAGTPRVKRHLKSTHADPTPATDGRHVVAMLGSQGLFCYDTQGNLKWKQDLGTLDAGYYLAKAAQWEYGSSPIIHDGLVIVQVDIQEGSFIRAYRLADGNQVWDTPRDEIPSWSTPTVHTSGDRTDLITNATRAIRGYDPATGTERWRLEGNATIVVPTPFVVDDLIYIASGYRPIQPIYAIRFGATGDITLPEGRSSSEHVAWSQSKRGPYMPTPVVYDGLLYVSDHGILTVYDAQSGEKIYNERLPNASGAYISALVAGDGKVYITSEDGDVYVVKAGDEFELLATNPLGETILATPAISDGRILLRGRHHLFAVQAE